MDRGRGSARVPELSRLASERSGASRACTRLHDRPVHEPFGERSGKSAAEIAIQRNAPDDRSGSCSRNSAAIAFYGEGRSRLSCARAFGENIKRRGIAANSIGRTARLELARRTLCPRRADNRFASARQPALARYADRPAEQRELANYRRARRRNDATR